MKLNLLEICQRKNCSFGSLLEANSAKRRNSSNDRNILETDMCLEKLLQVQVIDTGIGITQEESENLFKLFGTIRNKSMNKSGTGLGLVICKMLAEKMGGTIYF